MAAEELVKGILPRDVDGQTTPAPPRPAPHLTQAGDRPRERDADGGVKLADVDAELQRVGGYDAEQLAVGQPPFDLVSLSGRVTGAVGSDPLRQLRLEAIHRMAQDQLDALA